MEKTDLDKRINRLIGQIEGIRRMIHSKRETSATVQQILAVRQALSKIGIILIKDGFISSVSLSKEKHVERLMREVFRM